MALKTNKSYVDFDIHFSGTATYDVTTIPSNQIKIKASDGAADRAFGKRVAIGSGRIVVGTADSDLGFGSGAAYIYKIPETHDGYFEDIIDTLRFR